MNIPHHSCKNSVLILSQILLLGWGISLISPPVVAQVSARSVIAQSPSIRRPPTRLVYDNVGLAGIKLSMSEKQVTRLLGQPLQIKKGYEAIAGQTRTLVYPGLTVGLLEDVNATGRYSVYKLDATSSRYATLQGVKVGDPVSKVFAIYGQPEGGNQASDSISYPVQSESPVYFNFKLKNGRVEKISCGDFLG